MTICFGQGASNGACLSHGLGVSVTELSQGNLVWVQMSPKVQRSPRNIPCWGVSRSCSEFSRPSPTTACAERT